MNADKSHKSSEYISDKSIYWVHSVASKLPRKFDRAVLLFPSIVLVLKSSIKHLINVSCQVILVQVTQVRSDAVTVCTGCGNTVMNNTLILCDGFHTNCDKRLCKVPFMCLFYLMTPPTPLLSFLLLWPWVGVYSCKMLQLFLALLCIQFPKLQWVGRQASPSMTLWPVQH